MTGVVVILLALIQISISTPLVSNQTEDVEEFIGAPEGEMGPYFEGDMKISEEEIQQRLMSKSGINGVAYRWYRGVVSYELDGDFTPAEQDIMMDAMGMISSKTCIVFQRRSGQSKYVSITNSEKGCFSSALWSSPTGGLTVINLSRRKEDNCLGKGAGSVAHQLIHTLGFYHEHTRPDRDQYVMYQENNVDTVEHRSKFKVHSDKEVSTFGVSYDYDSIMHYGRNAYGRTVAGQKLETLTPINPMTAQIGQRKDLSKGDAAKINKMYECKDFQ